MVEKEEQIIVGVVVQVLRPVTLPPKYKTIFHGHTNLKPSSYVWWYPVKNIEYARLVNELQRYYPKQIKVNYGVAGTVYV